MWPFSSPTLSEEQAARLKRKCGLAAGTLRHCLAANAGNEKVCQQLENQVVHCYTEVVSPSLALEYSKCFRRVVNSRGRETYDACDSHIQAMQKCLGKYKLYPIVPSPLAKQQKR